jgi:hypothetical protein
VQTDFRTEKRVLWKSRVASIPPAFISYTSPTVKLKLQFIPPNAKR